MRKPKGRRRIARGSAARAARHMLSAKAERFTESVIREMTRLAMRYDAVNLAQGFPDFAAPAEIKEAARQAIADDINQYAITWMILRDCVRRQGRLPQTIVVDGGREFESTYFETLLARYECTKKNRRCRSGWPGFTASPSSGRFITPSPDCCATVTRAGSGICPRASAVCWATHGVFGPAKRGGMTKSSLPNYR